MVDAYVGGKRLYGEHADLVERAKLAPDQPVRVEELSRDTDTSHHLVSLRGREPLHMHERHSILVTLLDGYGRMHIDGEERAVGKGSVLYISRGTVHAFINESDSPAVAYVIYHPPYDGRDSKPAPDQ